MGSWSGLVCGLLNLPGQPTRVRSVVGLTYQASLPESGQWLVKLTKSAYPSQVSGWLNLPGHSTRVRSVVG